MREKGQVLIEVLIALGIAVIIIGATTGSIISSLRNAEYAKRQDLAGQYAQEANETLRRLSRSDWPSFSTRNGAYCLDTSQELQLKVGECPLIDDTFKRTITISANSLECSGNSKTEIIVSWTDDKCGSSPFCHDVSVTSCFANIYEIPFN